MQATVHSTPDRLFQENVQLSRRGGKHRLDMREVGRGDHDRVEIAARQIVEA
jgi:hypothetical protein